MGVLAETRPDSRCWLFDPCGTCHPFSSSHQFLLCERERVKKGLHRGLAEAPAAVMRPLLVVVDEPGIEIGLQFLDRAIDLFTERHPIELVEQRAMEALADAVGLWALGLGAAVIDVLDPPVRARTRGFPGRRTRCRDRSAPGTAGCRAHRRTAPPDRRGSRRR